MSAEHDPFSKINYELYGEVRVGGVTVALTPDNALVRRFDESEFDHCIFIRPDGKVDAFMPGKETLLAMEAADFPTRIDEFPDQETQDFLVMQFSNQLESL